VGKKEPALYRQVPLPGTDGIVNPVAAGRRIRFFARRESKALSMREPENPKKHCFTGHCIFLAELKEAINVRFYLVSVQSTDWHQNFCCGQVAQHLQLPLIECGTTVLEPVADDFRTIGKQGMPEFVSDGVIYARGWAVRIELDSESSPGSGERARVDYILAGSNLNS
jgi:hypothetical protein